LTGFRFRLYSTEMDELGEFETIAPNWSAGDEFLMGDGRRFRIVGIVPVPEDVGVFQRTLEGPGRLRLAYFEGDDALLRSEPCRVSVAPDTSQCALGQTNGDSGGRCAGDPATPLWR
jgi:hypothetical protein